MSEESNRANYIAGYSLQEIYYWLEVKAKAKVYAELCPSCGKGPCVKLCPAASAVKWHLVNKAFLGMSLSN